MRAPLFQPDSMTRVGKRLQPVRERHARMSKNRFSKALNQNVRFIFSSAGGDALRSPTCWEVGKRMLYAARLFVYTTNTVAKNNSDSFS